MNSHVLIKYYLFKVKSESLSIFSTLTPWGNYCWWIRVCSPDFFLPVDGVSTRISVRPLIQAVVGKLSEQGFHFLTILVSRCGPQYSFCQWNVSRNAASFLGWSFQQASVSLPHPALRLPVEAGGPRGVRNGRTTRWKDPGSLTHWGKKGHLPNNFELLWVRNQSTSVWVFPPLGAALLQLLAEP